MGTNSLPGLQSFRGKQCGITRGMENCICSQLIQTHIQRVWSSNNGENSSKISHSGCGLKRLTEVSSRGKCSPCSLNYLRPCIWGSRRVCDSHRQPGPRGFGVASLSDRVRYKGMPTPPKPSKIQREKQTARQKIFQLLV